MEPTTAQRRSGDRRRLWDRRAPIERRSSEERREGPRRSSTQSTAGERRSGSDRRSTDRRGSFAAERRSAASRRRRERRSTTPVPYTAAQVAELTTRFAAEGQVVCPACNGNRFTLGPARHDGPAAGRLALCLGCRRGAVIPVANAARVLLISEVVPLRNLLREMLVGGGHEVVEADDAAVGLDAYQAIPADLVIVDVLGTGRLQAPEFMRRMRGEFPDARIVALAGRSSYAGVDPAQVVEGLGDVRTVRVPVSRETLLKTVQELRG